MSLGAIPCGVVVFDDELRLVDANERAAELLGVSVDGLCGGLVSRFMSRGARIFFDTQIQPSLAMHGRVDEIYVELRADDGTDVPVVLSGRRELTPDGPRNTIAFLPMRRRRLFERELLSARDDAATAARHEHEAQAQARAAQSQLALRERLASLGTLAHGIAHEINNPLTYVAANLELILELVNESLDPRVADLHEVRTLATEALEGTERIREITRQMGHLVRAEEAPRVQIDPQSVASLVVRMTKVHTRTRARVDLVLGDVPLVDADSGRLGQILINLVVNAVHAFGDRPASENSIRISTATGADGEARIEVADNGPGIPTEVASRVFEPFFTTKPVGEGSGLGLSISQGLVQSLGGTLTFETEVGRGTTFRISLPPSAAARAPKAGGSHDGAPHRILVVDDDQGVARAIAKVLRRYDVTTVFSAEEALARIRSGPPFSYIFSDLQMPRQDGLALHAAVSEIDPALASRMAFVTGALTDDARAQFAKRGLPVFLKPIDVPHLLAFCDQHLPVEAGPAHD